MRVQCVKDRRVLVEDGRVDDLRGARAHGGEGVAVQLVRRVEVYRVRGAPGRIPKSTEPRAALADLLSALCDHVADRLRVEQAQRGDAADDRLEAADLVEVEAHDELGRVDALAQPLEREDSGRADERTRRKPALGRAQLLPERPAVSKVAAPVHAARGRATSGVVVRVADGRRRPQQHISSLLSLANGRRN
eukprot:scaffold55865_cov61-Phaeocystis_antarctica.AAC.5